MNLQADEIRYCLSKVKEFVQHYTLKYIAADDPLRSVDQLRETCETYLETPIRFIGLHINKEDSSVWGCCINIVDPGTKKVSFDICLVAGLNHCWTRYVACKELFHVILDKEDYRNMDIACHIADVTTSFPDEDSSPCNSVAIEFLAEVSAMEFLFPYQCRVQELSGELKNNFYAIADKYKVPQVLVERYLSPQYMANLDPGQY